MNRTTKIVFREKEYEITFPNNRQYIEIHSLKSKLSPRYQELGYSGIESGYAQQLVDTISHFKILCPDLEKTINVPMNDLSLEDGLELVGIYTKQFRPWYDDLLSFIFKPKVEDVKEKNNE